MPKLTALVLTCPNRNSSLVYKKGNSFKLVEILYIMIRICDLYIKELKLRQKKGLIDKETLIICIEDPEKPIGSGGATLNALQIVAEALSARKKYRVFQNKHSHT